MVSGGFRACRPVRQVGCTWVLFTVRHHPGGKPWPCIRYTVHTMAVCSAYHASFIMCSEAEAPNYVISPDLRFLELASRLRDRASSSSHLCLFEAHSTLRTRLHLQFARDGRDVAVHPHATASPAAATAATTTTVAALWTTPTTLPKRPALLPSVARTSARRPDGVQLWAAVRSDATAVHSWTV